VKPLEWEITTRNVVNAPVDHVMAWWFHPDRLTDFERRTAGFAVTDLTVDLSTEDGVRVRVASWKDRRGWYNDHRTETYLGPDGMATPTGDRFVAAFRETTDLRSPRNRDLAFRCRGQFEFIPTDEGATEVVSKHNHSLTGGNWLQRQKIWKSDLESQPRLYCERCENCEADLRSQP
jgi:hypothetical protein